ncbi:hypothetical protein BT69DRAFT_575817 [Atractiella rhizophila]|nr:hypothetical protein BT69DRAFT_575817 [Atractiella rhizophila]
MDNLPPSNLRCENPDRACSVRTNRVWQFRQYGKTEDSDMVGIPLQFMVDPYGKTLTYYNKPTQSEYVALWQTEAIAETWYSLTVRITTGRTNEIGITELWMDGAKQVLTTGSTVARCPTWDGVVTEPKWGSYGMWQTPVTISVGKITISDSIDEALVQKLLDGISFRTEEVLGGLIPKVSPPNLVGNPF